MANALQRSTLQTGSKRSISKTLRDFERAKKKQKLNALRGGAKALRKSMRQVVGGKKKTSEPGQAPARHEGRLQRSMQYGMVDRAMRIGTGFFVGRLLQDGVYAHDITILPRPWAEESLTRAEPAMGTNIVMALKKAGDK